MKYLVISHLTYLFSLQVISNSLSFISSSCPPPLPPPQALLSVVTFASKTNFPHSQWSLATACLFYPVVFKYFSNLSFHLYVYFLFYFH